MNFSKLSVEAQQIVISKIESTILIGVDMNEKERGNVFWNNR